MQSSGSSHQSHRLSEQHDGQPKDEGEVRKLHGGKRTEPCCSLSAILRYCARAPKQPSAVAKYVGDCVPLRPAVHVSY